jgi:cell division protein FtsN
MSRNPDNSNTPERRKSGNSLTIGILVGVLVGVCMAAGVAWYIMKSPSPYTNKEQAKPEIAKPVASHATEKPAAPTGDQKPRFEFYNVLTDKDANSVPTKPTDKSPLAKSPKTDSKPAAVYEPQILQAGSFPSVNDAENLKAKLALLGLEANIQTATIPDKGLWYRVRVGPYKNAGEMNHARNFMKQNGVESTPMRAP